MCVITGEGIRKLEQELNALPPTWGARGVVVGGAGWGIV